MVDQLALAARRVAPDEMTPLHGPGVYAYYVRDEQCLPGIDKGQDGLIYVGMTEQGLDARNHVTHKHSGFSTLRRSLGALLKDKLDLRALPRSAGKSRSNTLCYRFDDEGEKALTAWMQENLLCAQIEVTNDVAASEADLISALQPPLNLKGWRNPDASEIKALRALCAVEAERAR